MQMVRGQKTPLSNLTPSTTVEVGVRLPTSAGVTIDVSCFGLDAEGKLSDERYFIFYNQRVSPCGGVTSQGAKGGDQEVFGVDLSRLPPTIKRLVFTAAIDGAGSMSDLQPGALRVLADGREVASFSLKGGDFGNEKAIMIADLYFKDVWRFAANGQGFNGGLGALLAHFGGQEAKGPAAPPTPTHAVPVPPPQKVNLGKVTLEKRGSRQVVDLKKGGAGSGQIHVNLNWDAPPQKPGLFGGLFNTTPEKPDLDLGCMYQMADGTRGVIQPLGGNFGSRHAPPYILLDKDDRSGASSDGENLYITRPDLIDRVMIFALIYEGAASFATVNGRMTIRRPEGEIEIRMDAPDPSQTFCSVCLIERKGDQLSFTKEEHYFLGHEYADKHYGFGFRWKAGQK